MAYLNTAFNSISPYQSTRIYPDFSGRPSQATKATVRNQLMQTVESIKVFFWNRLQLVGLENKGTIPPFFMHMQEKNAYYYPSTSTYPERIKFNDAYVSFPEVVCHEFTHGVVEHLNPLGNKGESGALNESIADVIGIMFKRTVYARADWKIGNLRDLSQSFTKDHLKSTNPRNFDHGNVHHNSRLLSHAYYLAYTALEKQNADPNHQLLQIWWRAFAELKDEEKTFAGFANKTIAIGNETLFPIRQAIEEAWSQVKLLPPRHSRRDW